MVPFRTLLTPTNDLFPSLMVGVCLVFVPDVELFPISRKQQLPCCCCLFFYF